MRQFWDERLSQVSLSAVARAVQYFRVCAHRNVGSQMDKATFLFKMDLHDTTGSVIGPMIETLVAVEGGLLSFRGGAARSAREGDIEVPRSEGHGVSRSQPLGSPGPSARTVEAPPPPA
eukprot:758608-Pyramimonas_sp.AAC.1